MLRLAVIFLTVCAAFACDKPPEPPTTQEPPDWVKEAQARSKAQQDLDDSAPLEPDVPPVVDKPLLWSVTAHGGAKNTLLGTYHVGTDFPGLPGLPVSVRAAFQASDTVVLEADVGAADFEAVAKYVVLPGPKKLSSMMKPDEWDILLEETGMVPRELDQLQPHVAVGKLVERWTPTASVRGMDGRFLILARAHDKKLRYLETMAEQLEVLSPQ